MIGESCDPPTPECWLSSGDKTRQEAWIQIRKKDGSIGWTDQPGHFEQTGSRF